LVSFFYSTGGLESSRRNFTPKDLTKLLQRHKPSLQELHLDLGEWYLDYPLAAFTSLRDFTKLQRLFTTLNTFGELLLGPWCTEDDDEDSKHGGIVGLAA